MAFLRDVHPDDKIRLHQWPAESRNKHRDGGTSRERVGMFPLMHPTDDKTPSTIHLSVMAVLWSDVGSLHGELTPLTDGRQRLSGQTLSRDGNP